MKDSTVSARVENNVKIEAEEILQKLGVPVSVVINSLYRQIIYQPWSSIFINDSFRTSNH